MTGLGCQAAGGQIAEGAGQKFKNWWDNEAKPAFKAEMKELVSEGLKGVQEGLSGAAEKKAQAELDRLNARIAELQAKPDRTLAEDAELYGKGAMAYMLVRWLERKGMAVKKLPGLPATPT